MHNEPMVLRTAYKSSGTKFFRYSIVPGPVLFFAVSYYTNQEPECFVSSSDSLRSVFSLSDPNRRPDSPSSGLRNPTGNPRTLQQAWKTTVVHIWDCSWTRPPSTTALCWGASCQAGYGSTCPTFCRRGYETTLAGP